MTTQPVSSPPAPSPTLDALAAALDAAGVDCFREEAAVVIPAGTRTFVAALSGCHVDPWRVTEYAGPHDTHAAPVAVWTAPVTAVVRYLARNASPARPTTPGPVAAAVTALAAHPCPKHEAAARAVEREARLRYLDHASTKQGRAHRASTWPAPAWTARARFVGTLTVGLLTAGGVFGAPHLLAALAR